ncbi:hypothetical protein ALC57_01011 [Trachymyrmex cornetzi]|uniref:Tyr recombinase domain-containing protein n=1 Tax=Trachymyrmex cornetzi TaxID=471704 RepID=A0A151JR64_9HYME|nr:hypothetical protein ALC57_01011 [Trachymyrmex cornetzi]
MASLSESSLKQYDRNIVIKEDMIEIKIPDRIKTFKPGSKQPLLVLLIYEKDPNICPVRTLQIYLQKTKDLRKNINSLFITFKRPFKKVSSQTLNRWLKDILYSSEIDTDIFSVHSTRHASTSAARRKGISIGNRLDERRDRLPSQDFMIGPLAMI